MIILSATGAFNAYHFEVPHNLSKNDYFSSSNRLVPEFQNKSIVLLIKDQVLSDARLGKTKAPTARKFFAESFRRGILAKPKYPSGMTRNKISPRSGVNLIFGFQTENC